MEEVEGPLGGALNGLGPPPNGLDDHFGWLLEVDVSVVLGLAGVEGAPKGEFWIGVVDFDSSIGPDEKAPALPLGKGEKDCLPPVPGGCCGLPPKGEKDCFVGDTPFADDDDDDDGMVDEDDDEEGPFHCPFGAGCCGLLPKGEKDCFLGGVPVADVDEGIVGDEEPLVGCDGDWSNGEAGVLVGGGKEEESEGVFVDCDGCLTAGAKGVGPPDVLGVAGVFPNEMEVGGFLTASVLENSLATVGRGLDGRPCDDPEEKSSIDRCSSRRNMSF